MREELDLVDEAVRPLLEEALKQGAPPFVAGYEPEVADGSGWILEAAWPEAKVAALIADGDHADEQLVAWLRNNGWDARPVDDWNAQELVAAIARGMAKS